MNSLIAYRADIQLLRGVSVLLVVLYHLNIPGFHNGFMGVDIFFVLSGYLMATLADKVSPLEFYKRRLKRLLPAYLVVVFLTTLAVILLTVPVDADQRLGRVFYDLLAISNFSFWAENSYFSSTAFKPLLNLWSLAVELQFYLIAPFILPFLRQRKAILTLVIVCSFFVSIGLITISPKTSFFMLPTRLWEFLFGAAGAWLNGYQTLFKSSQRLRLLFVFILLTVMAIYPLPEDSMDVFTGHPGIAALILVIATTALLVMRLDALIPMDSFISKLLIKTGDYSYSIYLTHFPIIVLVNYHAFGGTSLGFENAAQLGIMVALTAITSSILFHRIETLRYSKQISHSIVTFIVAIVLLGVFGTALNTMKYSDSERMIFNAWKDRSSYRCGKLNRILSPMSNTCVLSDMVAGSKVLLLGNSHADAIKTAFEHAMTQQQLTSYFYVANNPLMSPKVDETVVKKEVAIHQINAVVLHYSPNVYHDAHHLVRIKSFIKSMQDLHVDVYMIAPVPVYSAHVPKAMLQALDDPEGHFPETDLVKYTQDTSGFDRFIKEIAISREDILLPHQVLCSDSQCSYQKNGVPFYFDSEHLTLTGASTLSPLFSQLAIKIASKHQS